MPDPTRSHSWTDPYALMLERRATSGLDFFGRMAAGELPQVPMYDTVGIRLEEVTDGRSAFSFTPAAYLYNPLGTIHGGMPAILIDSATGVAVQSQVPANVTTATIRLSVDYIRPMLADTGPLECVAELVKPGRQTAIADARIVGPDGKLYARGSATFMMTPLDPDKPAACPRDRPECAAAPDLRLDATRIPRRGRADPRRHRLPRRHLLGHPAPAHDQPDPGLLPGEREGG